MRKLFNVTSAIVLTAAGMISGSVQAQDLIADASTGPVETKVRDTVENRGNRVKIDGVSAVVGDFVILESDIDKQFIDMKMQGFDTNNITRCEVLGNLMEEKMYTHQAIQDSIIVGDVEVNSYVENQMSQLVAQVGSMEKVLNFYNKNSEKELKDELFDIIKNAQLAQRMRGKVVEEVEITPEEVRQWYDALPEDERPYFGDEVEIAQIVKEPKPTEEAKQKAIDKLLTFKRDIEDNGSSFAIKQTLYSDDPGKNQNGGIYTITKNSQFVQEFKDVAFTLREGEISEPFETQFGFHIIKVEKIRGQELDVRHILVIPEVSEKAKEDAKVELDSIRSMINDGKFTFEEAARNFSDQKETRFDGGVLRNPNTFDTRFELTKMDPILYGQVSKLQGEEISRPLLQETRSGGVTYKIIKINKRYSAHKADYIQDYVKIKELALKEKQFKEIEKWMNEKIKDTYISVSPESQSCDFHSNWLKK
ncbi:peptidylprolyl isomerase [Robertkochia solimangrovi]|uniref:peptidylprolyl isomerase n=1 Tax=Robertkochia solimangrovi TaxID=2213046 RepID=UPI00117EA33D|nr:peptidylprolyl isomerase [Robertkochia solimangrovi]TRZ42765.1 peptidylprolyl isomerase [Robertkochia solimangrovi]